MSLPGRPARPRSGRRNEIILLSLLLSAGVVGFELMIQAIFTHAGGGLKQDMRDILISVPVAVTAAWLGLRLSSRMGLDRSGHAALNKAAVVSLLFMVLQVPAQAATARLAGPGVMMYHGLTGALLGQAIGLPMLFAALLLLGWSRARRGPGLPRLALAPARHWQFIGAATSIACIGYFAGPGAGMAAASTSLGAVTPATTTTTSNPCSTAPADTFNISAINVDMPLNRFGTHDPNGFMYVLNQNISAVRSEEQSQQVSSGLQGGDAIQPLVIRAHAGDCVTVNLTNATTFGVSAMDQPPPPTTDPADACTPDTFFACDGSLVHTGAQNIGWNVDGLPGLSAATVSGPVGKNADNTAAPGQTVSYTVYMDPALGYGAHLFHSSGDFRQTQGHGLFGTLVEEPAGSQWLDPHTNQAIASGWDATIVPSSGPSFREFNLLFADVGDEGYRQIMEAAGAPCATDQGEVQTSSGCELPVVDKFTDGYRPCSKAINYRSECFFEREMAQVRAGFTPDESQDYGSYMNGDMATPRPEAYVGDPYKILLTNAGSEMGHVFHEHGGGIRWLRNPQAANPDIAGGLEKNPPVSKASIRLDSQTIEPGESYDLETECGAGGCQQAAGDFLFHCHIASHYDAGMLGFIRVFDTQQPDLATVPGRTAKPAAVNSAGLIGKTIEGKTVVPADQLTDPSTQISVQDLVTNQLPPQGTRLNPQDATVWDWTFGGTADQPIALGEPEDTHVWANYTAPNPGQRPEIMFDPSNGRYAWPLLQPHLGERPPFSPNGHSGAPWLGPNVTSTRPDGLCPSGAPLRTYNITAIQTPINDQTDSGRDANGNPINPVADPNGEIFVLNQDVAAVENGTKPAQPLAIRSDVGDCVALTLTNNLNPSTAGESTDEENIFRKLNIHTHFVQFDPQASDGVITGLSYEQAVRPITGGEAGETTLAKSASAGDTVITVNDITGLVPGVSIEIGQGLPDTEIATKIVSITDHKLTLSQPLQNAHATGEPTGVEFVQYRWYSDVDDGTVFFHDHVDGLNSWGHGLFAAHIIEPAGSTFHDPVTGAQISSGPIADIYTKGSVGFGESGDFREYVLWEHEGIRSSGSPQGCEMSSFNLRAAPLINRDPNAANTPIPDGEDVSVPDGVGNYTMGFAAHEEPAGSDRVDCTAIGTSNDPYAFSSVAHGDPPTPLLKAYVGDNVVIRQVGLDEHVGDIRVTGHRFAEERFNQNGVLTDAGTAGISEKMDYVFNAGRFAGDYLYYSGRSLELESGAWGIFRVMNTLHTSGPNALEPLPDRTAPPTGTGFPTLTTTGKAPPAANSASTSICPSTAPVRSLKVSLFNGIFFDKGMPGESDTADGVHSWAMMYSLSNDESGILNGTKPVVPLAIRANAGDCLVVTLKNDLPADSFTWTWGSGTTRAGLNIGNVIYDPQRSNGAAIGFDPDSSVAPGSSRSYVYYVDKELGTNLMLNLANESSWRAGAYGALIAEPKGSVYEDPFTGAQVNSGIFVDIFPGSGSAFRENVSMFSDREPKLGHSIMDYYLDSDHSYLDYNEASLTDREPTDEGGDGNGNCGTSPCADPFPLWLAKSDSVNGGADPTTPLFEAFPNDPVRWRVVDASGDNVISFQVSGHSFPLDHGLTGSQIIEARTLVGGETLDAYLVNGAGGATGATGDYEYNVGRDPIIKSGDWGLFRVLPTTCSGCASPATSTGSTLLGL